MVKSVSTTAQDKIEEKVNKILSGGKKVQIIKYLEIYILLWSLL